MYRLLVVDDEPKIRELIRKYAEFEGHEVTEAGDGMEAVKLCRENKYDLLILDIMMPNLDGFSTCKEIRKFSNVPVIMLSARGDEFDKIHGFDLGIDDYVVKPFSPKELLMRIDAVMKRSGAGQEKREEVAAEGLILDITGHTVFIDGEKVLMSPKEYDLLKYLMENRGIALRREQILEKVWGYDFFGDDRTLDTHIKLLRVKLGKYQSYVTTLRGVGYRFEG